MLLVALLLRLGVVLDSRPYTPVGDSHDYGRHAQSIAEELEYPRSLDGPDGGPTAFRPPLYPLFLAPFYAIGGNDGVEAARIAQAFLGVAVAALIGLICWMLWGRRVGLIALALASLFPPFMLIGAALLSETLFLVLVLAACAAMLQQRRSAHPLGWVAVAGTLFGLAVLTRSAGGILILPLALALVRPTGAGWRTVVLPLTVLLAGAILTVAPWTLRNAIVMDSFVPVSTEGGHTLAGAFNETVRGSEGAWQPPWTLPDFADLYWRPRFQQAALRARKAPGVLPRAWRTDLSEPELDRKLRAAAWDYMAEHPTYVLERFASNTVRLFQLRDPRVTNRNLALELVGLGTPWPRRAAMYLFYPVLGLALLGAFTARARRAPRWLWLVPALFLPAVVIFSFARFRAPIDAFLIMLAALAIAALADRLRLGTSGKSCERQAGRR